MSAVHDSPILLFEPSAVLRQTVALTAISIGAGYVWQASNVKAAQEMLETQSFVGAMLAVDGNDSYANSALPIIESIRAGTTASSPDIPVYVIVDSCSQSLLTKLSTLNVQRVLIKPFKARVLIEALSSSFRAPHYTQISPIL